MIENLKRAPHQELLKLLKLYQLPEGRNYHEREENIRLFITSAQVDKEKGIEELNKMIKKFEERIASLQEESQEDQNQNRDDQADLQRGIDRLKDKVDIYNYVLTTM